MKSEKVRYEVVIRFALAMLLVSCSDQLESKQSETSENTTQNLNPVLTGRASGREEEPSLLQVEVSKLKEIGLSEGEFNSTIASLSSNHLDSADEWFPVLEELLGKHNPRLQSIARNLIAGMAMLDDPALSATAIEIGRMYLESGTIESTEVATAFSNLARSNPKMAEDLLLKWPPGKDLEYITVGVASTLGESKAIDQAQALALIMPYSDLRDKIAQKSLGSYFLKLEDSEVEEYVKSVSSGADGGGYWAEEALNEGVKHLAISQWNFDRTASIIKSMSNDVIKGQALDYVFVSPILDYDPGSAALMIESITDERLRATNFRRFGNNYIQTDVEATKHWFESLRVDTDRTAAFRGIATSYTKLDPEGFIDWITDYQGLEDGFMDIAVGELQKLGLHFEANSLVELEKGSGLTDATKQ